MALNAAEYLQTDDLTILLALISATLFLLNNLYKPQPLVHPILLGRQSEAGRSRKPKESAIYRNYNTGLLGRFPLRPSKDVHIIADFVRPEVETSRTLWSTKLTNGGLQDRVAAFATGLIRVAGLQPQKSKVLLLLNDCIEFVVSDLALASHSIHSLTISSATLLSPVLDAHPPSAIICHAFLLPHLLEFIYDTHGRQAERTIIVIGEPTAQAMASMASNVKILKFEDVEREGTKADKIFSPLPKPSDVFTTSFYKNSSGQIQGAQFTHENFTAGVAAIRALFPAAMALSPLDTITSAYSLSTAYGRAIAYTAIHDGTSFATVQSSELFHPNENDVKSENVWTLTAKKYPIPSPTILFVKTGHLTSLVKAVDEVAKRSWLFPVAWRHKVAEIYEGFVTNQSLWDRLVFDGARGQAAGPMGASVRGVVVSGDLLDAELLTPARAVLSVPLINAFTHPLCAAPVLASHALDLQAFPASGEVNRVAHSGPPSLNVEAKLVGVNDSEVEAGGDPTGNLLIRGPPVGKTASLEKEQSEPGSDSEYVDVGAADAKKSQTQSSEEDSWTSAEVKARVLSNGAFVVLGK
ncbi:hypothetical protein CPB83DRAFT_845124 [Crepidotus variabilis]|uniref:AMP-dependent synthetase/ligase domain-containing protein n=1 Tax=Crepidotus variabilis TaxID=179855 RepID=A0A9P6JUF0_9AGAR|nr:hypothetical protein CPB83DRAFT_845124 [Crepidotus variabilis]